MCRVLSYVPESDPEEDPEDDDDENPEKDPVDEGDEDESSDDDEDEDVDIEGDEEEEEEEHPAPADSIAVALPAVDQTPSTEETKPFETDESAATPPPHPAYRVARLLAIPTPPPSPFSPWSSPLPQIPSPPLPFDTSHSPLLAVALAKAPSTSHSPPPIILSHTRSDAPSSGTPPLLPIPLPTSSPPLHLLSTDRRADRPEVTLPPRKRVDYGFVATMDREIMQDLERDVGYGITDTWDEMLTEQQLMAGWLNMLYRDRRAHARTARLMETEARMSREAWGRSMEVSDLARAEVMSLHTTVLAQ
ncbi:hypothetical protein Tco_1323860 [Tanacetum coccineum]